MGALAGCLGLLLLQIMSYIINGLALRLLWTWFLVELGLPPLGLFQAIGVGLTIGYLTHQYVKNDGADWQEILSYQFMLPVVAVAVGWVVQSFM